MRAASLLVFSALALAIGACGGAEVSNLGTTPGDDDDDSTPIPTAEPQDSFELTASAASTSMDVLKTSVINFTITPANGFTGSVIVDLLAHPASGITSKGATTVNVTGAAPVTGSLTISTEDYEDVIPGPYTDLRIRGTSGELQSDATFSMLVNAKIQWTIPAGIGTSDAATTAFGPDVTRGLVLHMGKNASGAVNTSYVVEWMNADSVIHTIHTGGYAGEGFEHGDTNVANNDGGPGTVQSRTITPNYTGADVNGDGLVDRTYAPNNFYCHVHGASNQQAGRLVLLQPAP